MSSPTRNAYFYTHTTHSPHTEPDPRIDRPPSYDSHVLTTTTTNTWVHPASITTSQDGQYASTLSPPHSPHTQPDPRVQSPPIYSLPVSNLLGLLDIPLDALPPNNPHTAPVTFFSSNPSPQSGDVQVDFMPAPVSSLSEPSEPSLTIPDTDDDAKYEEQDLDRRNSYSTLASTPDANNDTKYEMEDSASHSLPSPSSSTSTLVVSVTSQAGTLVPQSKERKAEVKKASSVKGSFIDTDLEKYEMDPSTTEKGSTFMRMLGNRRTKIVCIACFVVLAVVFGVLGATVWKPSRDTSPAGDIEDKSLMQ